MNTVVYALALLSSFIMHGGNKEEALEALSTLTGYPVDILKNVAIQFQAQLPTVH